MPQHGESFEFPVEEFAQCLRRDVAAPKAGTAVGDDDLDTGIVDPRPGLALNEGLIVAHQPAGVNLMAGGGGEFRE